jgi:diguanylate cyclase
MLQRLKNDSQLAIVSLFGSCAALGIIPFGVYRLLAGEWLIAAVDFAIVLGIVATLLQAWRSGDPAKAGLVMAGVTTIGCGAVVAMFGSHGLPWVYLVMVTNFFLTTRRVALVASVSLLIGIALLVPRLHPDLFPTTLAAIAYFVTTALVGINAWIFALRTDNQREQLERLASHDPLTNAANRRVMETDLFEAVAAHARDRLPCGLAVLDLDHFKAVNDACGHEAGDRVLTDFAHLVQRGIRLRDRLYRLGGEEFVLLLPGCDDARLHTALEHLMTRIRAELRAPNGPVTVSIGAATLVPDEPWSVWLARADAAMYEAKRNGRDGVVIARVLVAEPCIDAAKPASVTPKPAPSPQAS